MSVNNWLNYASGQGPPLVSNMLKYCHLSLGYCLLRWCNWGGSIEVVPLRWCNWGGSIEEDRLRRIDWGGSIEAVQLRRFNWGGSIEVVQLRRFNWGGSIEEVQLRRFNCAVFQILYNSTTFRAKDLHLFQTLSFIIISSLWYLSVSQVVKVAIPGSESY